MFTIDVDAPNRMLRVRMSGFMTPDEVKDFSAREQALIERMGWRSGGFRLLVDASECAIQSQETVTALAGIVAYSRYKADRIAVVRGTSLTRMQTRRIITTRADAAIFESLAEAETWINRDGGADRRLP